MFYQTNLKGIPHFAFGELEAIPGFVHAITSRQTDSVLKDASSGPGVAFDIQTFLDVLGIAGDSFCALRQMHSDRTVVIDDRWTAPRTGDRRPEGDGHLVLAAGNFTGIRTADCLPVLVVSGSRRRHCTLHAGWRGTRDRIAEKGVARFKELAGESGEDLIAALGPCIRRCCYEVGPDVRDAFQKAGHEVDRFLIGNRLDLVAANIAQLRGMGVDNIIDCGLCTCCRADLFYSYRRDRTPHRFWTIAGFRL